MLFVEMLALLYLKILFPYEIFGLNKIRSFRFRGFLNTCQKKTYHSCKFNLFALWHNFSPVSYHGIHLVEGRMEESGGKLKIMIEGLRFF